jgi:hypothetical protein
MCAIGEIGQRNLIEGIAKSAVTFLLSASRKRNDRAGSRRPGVVAMTSGGTSFMLSTIISAMCR